MGGASAFGESASTFVLSPVFTSGRTASYESLAQEELAAGLLRFSRPGFATGVAGAAPWEKTFLKGNGGDADLIAVVVTRGAPDGLPAVRGAISLLRIWARHAISSCLQHFFYSFAALLTTASQDPAIRQVLQQAEASVSFPYAQPAVTSLPSVLATEFSAAHGGSPAGGLLVAGDCGKARRAIIFSHVTFCRGRGRSSTVSPVDGLAACTIATLAICAPRYALRAIDVLRRARALSSVFPQAFPEVPGAVHVDFDANKLTAALQKQLEGALLEWRSHFSVSAQDSPCHAIPATLSVSSDIRRGA